jgi:ABC-2 type transport system permease protein
MVRVIRCEWTRLWNRATILVGIGLMTLFGVMATTIVAVTTTGDPGVAPPGAGRVTLGMLEASDGMFAGVENFLGMLGIVALSVWGMSAASDYSTGLIRLLVQAEPDRFRLLGGKVVALAAFTCLATLIMTMVVTAVAPPVAQGAGVSIDAWREGGATTVLAAYGRITFSVLLWGVMGLLIGVLTRSGGAAIGIGVGYLLVFEGLLGLVLDGGSRWLPGGAFSAIAAGGSDEMAFGSALLLGAAYAVAAIVAAAVVFRRRDITA